MIKLQHLAVIFAIIIIPVSLLLGYYVRSEIDTIKLQASYDECLINATYDAIRAYQINTVKDKYSEIKTSEKREVEAAISTFINSFATGLGVSGYGENAIKTYIPAILFTLNRSFYIYAPTFNVEPNQDDLSKGEFDHILKPYYTYTARYSNNEYGTNKIDVCISYSLDNYITVTGIVGGELKNRAGYLVDNNLEVINGEELFEKLPIHVDGDSTPIYKVFKYRYMSGLDTDTEKIYFDTDNNRWFYYKNGDKLYLALETNDTLDYKAMQYNEDSRDFTNWVKTYLGSLTVKNMVLSEEVKERNTYLHFLGDENSKIFDGDFVENSNSVFNIHKSDIIRMSINENLSSAITGYNNHSGVNGVFKMPTLKETEWDQITKNICAIAFVQGMPVGFKIYNSYAIVNNTENSSFIDEDDLVFIIKKSNPSASNNPSNEYHNINCTKLKEQIDNSSTPVELVGYKKTDFDATSVELIYFDASGNRVREKVNYYKHDNLPCYNCIVSKNNAIDNYKTDTDKTRLKAMQRALGREKQLINRENELVN